MKRTLRRSAVAASALLAANMLAPEPAFADSVSDEASFFQRLNDVRMARGLRPLEWSTGLSRMATGWSTQMASRGSISHNPNMAAEAPADWARLGENVGMGPSVDSIHNALVASPSHYANIVNVHYDSVGVGTVPRGTTKFVTFNFMATRGSSAETPAAVRSTRRIGRLSNRRQGTPPPTNLVAEAAPQPLPGLGPSGESSKGAGPEVAPGPEPAPVRPPAGEDVVMARLATMREVLAEMAPPRSKGRRPIAISGR